MGDVVCAVGFGVAMTWVVGLVAMKMCLVLRFHGQHGADDWPGGLGCRCWRWGWSWIHPWKCCQCCCWSWGWRRGRGALALVRWLQVHIGRLWKCGLVGRVVMAVVVLVFAIGRQAWRPVRPDVRRDRVVTTFLGPRRVCSPRRQSCVPRPMASGLGLMAAMLLRPVPRCVGCWPRWWAGVALPGLRVVGSTPMCGGVAAMGQVARFASVVPSRAILGCCLGGEARLAQLVRLVAQLLHEAGVHRASCWLGRGCWLGLVALGCASVKLLWLGWLVLLLLALWQGLAVVLPGCSPAGAGGWCLWCRPSRALLGGCPRPKFWGRGGDSVVAGVLLATSDGLA